MIHPKLAAAVLVMQVAVSHAASCIISEGSETYPVSTACSQPTALAFSASIAEKTNDAAVETRHFLSAFSGIWDILAENPAFMIYVR